MVEQKRNPGETVPRGSQAHTFTSLHLSAQNGWRLPVSEMPSGNLLYCPSAKHFLAWGRESRYVVQAGLKLTM